MILPDHIKLVFLPNHMRKLRSLIIREATEQGLITAADVAEILLREFTIADDPEIVIVREIIEQAVAPLNKCDFLNRATLRRRTSTTERHRIGFHPLQCRRSKAGSNTRCGCRNTIASPFVSPVSPSTSSDRTRRPDLNKGRLSMRLRRALAVE